MDIAAGRAATTGDGVQRLDGFVGAFSANCPGSVRLAAAHANLVAPTIAAAVVGSARDAFSARGQDVPAAA